MTWPEGTVNDKLSSATTEPKRRDSPSSDSTPPLFLRRTLKSESDTPSVACPIHSSKFGRVGENLPTKGTKRLLRRGLGCR